ncbi:hypothetical protein FACS1894167_11960 [Synergistales bacterium]|nr:hypothetical protein FACS1894167_11960 [Synergistales bacterium]
MRLGSTWIDKGYVQDFMYDLLETPRGNRNQITVEYSSFTSDWNIKWKDEQEKLKAERGGLNREYTVLKEKVREIEVIRKYAEDAQRAINPPIKQKSQGIAI